MKEKLELKHLAQYLPYGLMVMTKWHKDGKFNKPKILRGQDLDILKNSKNLQIKPLLHPLERLIQPTTHNGKTFIPAKILFQVSLKEEDDYAVFGDVPEYWRTALKENPNQYEWWQVKKLFEWHFDVFGLIEKGLAEPIKI